jgi:hypothetical protein
MKFTPIFRNIIKNRLRIHHKRFRRHCKNTKLTYYIKEAKKKPCRSNIFNDNISGFITIKMGKATFRILDEPHALSVAYHNANSKWCKC